MTREYVQKKYVMHPDRSVGFIQLCRAYGVNPTQCFNFNAKDDEIYPCGYPEGVVHLYPRYDGDYQLPEE